MTPSPTCSRASARRRERHQHRRRRASMASLLGTPPCYVHVAPATRPRSGRQGNPIATRRALQHTTPRCRGLGRLLGTSEGWLSMTTKWTVCKRPKAASWQLWFVLLLLGNQLHTVFVSCFCSEQRVILGKMMRFQATSEIVSCSRGGYQGTEWWTKGPLHHRLTKS